MKGAFSSCKGIMIYDTDREGNQARYAYYENEKIVVEEGKYEDIKKLKQDHQKDFERDSVMDKIVVGLFLLMVIMSIVSFIVFPLLYLIAVVIFCIGAYFPIIVLLFSHINIYNNKEMYHQARRYHACEHAMLNLLTKNQEINLENLKNASIYEAECGNVYAGMILFLVLELSCLIVNVVNIGLLKAFVILLITVILLFINIFNPYNPFKLLQKPTIEQPSDKEYLLVIELVKNW